MSTTATSTPDQLLNALRQTSGIDDLDWATPPAPLHGGFWAEMYTVELADPPAALAGRLVARIMPDPDTAAFETAIQRHVHRCGPAPVRAIARNVGSRLARRFLRTYTHLSGTTVDPARLAWGQSVHALRALVEIATSEAAGQIDAHAGHPWLAMRPILDTQLSTQ